MAAQERVYILSPDYWGFDPATQDTALNFFTNVWTLPKATYDGLGEEDRQRLYRCALFYHTKRVDNHGFTPIAIFDKDADLMVRGTGRGGLPQVRKYSTGSQSPPYTVDTITMAAADPSSTTWDELADQTKQSADGTFTIGSYMFDENKIMETINNLESEVGTVVGASAAESYSAESTPASVAVDVSEPLSVNPTAEAPSGSEVIYEAPRTDREGPGLRTLKHRMSAKDRAMARRKAREAKESRIQAGLRDTLEAETEMSQLMTTNAFGQAGADYDHEIHYRAETHPTNMSDEQLLSQFQMDHDWLIDNGFTSFHQIVSDGGPIDEEAFSHLQNMATTSTVMGHRGKQRQEYLDMEKVLMDFYLAGAEKNAVYRADSSETPANYVFNRDNELEQEIRKLEYEMRSIYQRNRGLMGNASKEEEKRYKSMRHTIEEHEKEREALNNVSLGAEDEAVLAHYANWSEDSTMLSGNGVPTYYGSAETFEAPMARYGPGKDDVNRVLASLRSRYSGLRVSGTPIYMTMRSGSSNKYHVFVRTNKGNFNGYGRIGYAPTIHGPMSDSEYDRKLRAKQRPSKGYEETKYAEANYSPMTETPSPHEPYSFMDEMTPNGEFITSDEFMELMSETLDGMSLRYEKPSMFGSPLALGVGGALVAALGYKLWSKRSESTE